MGRRSAAGLNRVNAAICPQISAGTSTPTGPDSPTAWWSGIEKAAGASVPCVTLMTRFCRLRHDFTLTADFVRQPNLADGA